MASLETAATPTSDAQCTKANAKADTDSPISKPWDTLKVSHSKRVLKSSIARELIRLEATEPAATWLSKDPRRRKDVSNARVLFSNHLEDDVVKQQKKVISMFPGSVPLMSEFFVQSYSEVRDNCLILIDFGTIQSTHSFISCRSLQIGLHAQITC